MINQPPPPITAKIIPSTIPPVDIAKKPSRCRSIIKRIAQPITPQIIQITKHITPESIYLASSLLKISNIKFTYYTVTIY